MVCGVAGRPDPASWLPASCTLAERSTLRPASAATSFNLATGSGRHLRGHEMYPTDEADRGRHPGFPSSNVLGGGPGSLSLSFGEKGDAVGKPVPLLDLPTDDGQTSVEFGLDWGELCRLWRMVLAMAVRDGAASVHYHPWRADGHLSYLVSGVRYELVPPPPALARRIAAVAGALACGSRLGAVMRRWLGWPIRTSGRVRLIGKTGESEWAVAGSRNGRWRCGRSARSAGSSGIALTP
jgi:hypothetical protein